MRFLILMSWEPGKAGEITERFKKWSPSKEVKYILPTHTVMGKNQAVSVVETDDSKFLARADRQWRDIAVIQFLPIMDSTEIAKVG